jgi:hypothetical protein
MILIDIKFNERLEVRQTHKQIKEVYDYLQFFD